jgi:PAS domain S-box-containing protein
MYILGKQAHYSGAAGMECDRTEKRKSELEQVAGILLRHANCRAQREPHVSVTPARDLLGLLVDRLEDGVVMIGPDQTVVWLNSAMERLFGVSGYETIGMNAVEFISHCISPCLMSGEALKEDFIVSCSFGEDIPVRRYCIIRNPDNRIRVDYSSTVIPEGPNRGARLDVYRVSPDSGRPEAGHQEYRQRYEVLAAVSPDPVISLDPGLTITSVSPPVQHLLGHDPNDLAGKHLSSIMDPESVAELRKACFRDRVSSGAAGALDPAGDVHCMEVTLTDAQNRPVAAFLRFSLVDDGEGSFSGLIAVAHRMTDDDLWRRVCSQLDENIEQLACLGDRIRNPLAVIIGLADLEENAVTRRISEQAKIVDEILTELDRGYVASLSVREFLRKHCNLEYDARSGSAGDTPSPSGSSTDTSTGSD